MDLLAKSRLPSPQRRSLRQSPQLVFSPGTITNTNSPIYGVPGFQTDQWLAAGASGSAVWRQTAGSSHRVISSGFSTGSFGTSSSGGRGFVVGSITNVLANGTVAGNALGINAAKLRSIGLVDLTRGWALSDDAGKLDVAPANGAFDVRERLDQVFGINSGTTTWLGFESPRRNRM